MFLDEDNIVLYPLISLPLVARLAISAVTDPTDAEVVRWRAWRWVLVLGSSYLG